MNDLRERLATMTPEELKDVRTRYAAMGDEADL